MTKLFTMQKAVSCGTCVAYTAGVIKPEKYKVQNYTIQAALCILLYAH